MGELFAAMPRIIQMGKMFKTNNLGYFPEISDNCVCKIDVEKFEDELCDRIISFFLQMTNIEK